MKPNAASDEMLLFLQALADARRLQLLALLALAPHSVEELAAILRLRASTVSHHLARLQRAGLAQARAEGYYSVYALVPGALEAGARRHLQRRALRARASGLDLAAYDHHILRPLLRRDGRLRSIPARRRRRMVVLRYLASRFRPGRGYREAAVDRILRRIHPEAPGLRAELVEVGLLDRKGEWYSRQAQPDLAPVPSQTANSHR
ncbi:MAG TPA: metalloregulator ArsR/SmtB family transcription factor [Anaerolineales bacterium]|nr:metalloregulator ArsR/SmtB family transcription factor [Anaerolineales bacterium]